MPGQALTVESMLADELAGAQQDGFAADHGAPAKGQPEKGKKDQAKRPAAPIGKHAGKSGGKPAPKAPKRRKGDA